MAKAALPVLVLISLIGLLSPINDVGIEQLNETTFLSSSQENETANITGCTNEFAINYDPNATNDNGDCYLFLDSGGYVIDSVEDNPLPILKVEYSPNGSSHAGIFTSPQSTLVISDTLGNTQVNATSNFSDSEFVDFDWSPNGSHIAVLDNQSRILIYNSHNGVMLSWFNTPDVPNGVSKLIYNHDGSLLSVNYNFYDRGVYEWNYGVVIINTSTGQEVNRFETSTASWSPDGTEIAIEGMVWVNSSWNPAWEKAILIYNTSNWELKHTLISQVRVVEIDYSPDGRYISTGCSGVLEIFETTNYEMLWPEPVSCSTYQGIEWSPDSSRFATIEIVSSIWVDLDGLYNSTGVNIVIFSVENGTMIDRLYNPCSMHYCLYVESIDWHPYETKIMSSLNINYINTTWDNRTSAIVIYSYDSSVEMTYGCLHGASPDFDPFARLSDNSCEEYYLQNPYYMGFPDGVPTQYPSNPENEDDSFNVSIDEEELTITFVIIIMIATFGALLVNRPRKSITTENYLETGFTESEITSPKESDTINVPKSVEIEIDETHE